MRQQQLITKQDLYSRYTYKCEVCWTEYKSQLDKYYILHEWEEVKKICKCCAKYRMLNSKSVVLYNWELYAANSGIATTYCDNCTRLKLDDWEPYCKKCCQQYRSYVYCTNCWWMHYKWDVCNQWVRNNYELLRNTDTSSLSIRTNKESKSWSAKWVWKYPWETLRKAMETLPFQEERKLPRNILENMESFYDDNYHWEHEDWFFDNYFYWQPTEIKGVVEYKRYDWLRSFKNKISEIENYSWKDIEKWLKANKYRNHFFQNISDDWLITWKYIDMYWWVREKKESINKFLQDNGLKTDTLSLSKKVYYRLSSDIKHKADSFEINNRLGSCQQPHNSCSYATWAYDAITNWCNCPILLYNSEEDEKKNICPIWRITSRLMYDKNWEMYILVDRLYNDWTLSGSKIKWMIYKLIIEDLKKQGYKVIVTNYSAHDNSTLQYLEALGMKYKWIVKDLWQPLRRLFNVNGDDGVCWYYSDWGIVVYQTEINWLNRASDYLNKWYLL